MEPRISASVMCADQLHLSRDIHMLEDAGIDLLHVDIMDGSFVPNITLGLQTCREIREATALPLDYHLLVQSPDWLADELPIQHGDSLSVHMESTCDIQSMSRSVRSRGGAFGLVLNPATPVAGIGPWLEFIDLVILMMIEPGFAGRPMVPGVLDKIEEARAFLDGNGCCDVPVEVDGNVSFANAPRMRRRGAELFVAGSSSVFSSGMTITEGTARLRKALASTAKR